MADDETLARREFLQTTAAAALLVGAGAARAEPSATVLDTRVLSVEPEYYHGWPTLARRANGDLLLVCSGGREAHVCPFGRVELRVSHDAGATWGWPQVLLDTALDDRDAGVLETARGTLLVSTFTSLAYEPLLAKLTGERRAAWQAAHDRLGATERQALLDQWLLRSNDGGLTWSAPYRCPVNSPHGPAQLADGRLLYAGKELWTGQRRVGVCESRDDGLTWQWLATFAPRPGDRVAEYHELHLVETAEQRLVVHVRNHNPTNAGETLQSESEDGGRTWSPLHPLGVWGLPSHLLRLRDGRLLMSYGHRRPPFGNQARVSADGGRTWSAPLLVSTDGAGGDLGYPSTVELADGTLYTAWYELLAGSTKAVLRGAHWQLSH